MSDLLRRLRNNEGPGIGLLVREAADRIEALEQAMRVIAEMPVPEQDNMIAANMRRIAIGAIK